MGRSCQALWEGEAKSQVFDSRDTGQVFFENRIAKDLWRLFTNRRGLTTVRFGSKERLCGILLKKEESKQ